VSGERQQAAIPGSRGKRLASAVGWGLVLLVILAGHARQLLAGTVAAPDRRATADIR